MSGRYLIRLTPPSPPPPPPSTSVHQYNIQQQQRPSDLLSSLQSLRTGFAAGQHVDQTAAITCNSAAAAAAGSAVLSSSSGPAQDSWTLRLDCCQEPGISWDAGAGSAHATTPSGAVANAAALPLARSSFYLPADRLLIQSVKWFTLGRCLLGLMQGATHSLILGSFFSSSAQTGRNLLAYPSDAHSQTRLMVAACVTVRVLSSLDWSSLPVSLALTPTPRVELQCCDE